MRFRPSLLALMLFLPGCSRTVNTLPPVAGPSAPQREVVLEIPEGMEIRSIHYDATMYSDVSGTSGNFGVTTTSVGGRAFVKVVAVERSTGEQVLLLYENILERSRPIQIIRFRSSAPPGSF